MLINFLKLQSDNDELLEMQVVVLNIDYTYHK